MKPTSNDVLKGRGVPIQNHPGNRYFRKVVADRKAQYSLMKKSADKEAVAIQVLKVIQSQTPPGRFVDQKEDGSYFLLDRSAALAKIKQALREGADKTSKSSETKTKKSSEAKPKKSISKPNEKSKKGSKDYKKEDMDRVLELLMKDK